MKKLINSMFALAIAAFTLTSCEDVPMPYDITFEKDNKTLLTWRLKALVQRTTLSIL